MGSIVVEYLVVRLDTGLCLELDDPVLVSAVG